MAARTLLFIACLLAFLLGCTHGKVVQSDSILKLNETVINQEMAKVEKGEGVLIQFYIPGCNYCKALVGEWLSFAETKCPENIKPAVVNCQADQLLCQHWGITEAPTIFLMKDDLIFEFTGDRTADELVAFVEQDHLRSPRRAVPRAINFKEIRKAKARREQEAAEGLATPTSFDPSALLDDYSTSTITMALAGLVTVFFLILGYCCSPSIEEEVDEKENKETKKKDNKDSKPKENSSEESTTRKRKKGKSDK